MKIDNWGRRVKNFSRLVVVSLALTPLLLLSSGANVSAAGGASGLSISPLRQELTLNAGQVSQFSISLKNITSGPIIAKAVVRDFESDNVTGNPKIITNPATTNPASIRNFITGLKDVPLAVNEQKTINVGVQVPLNASPGGYYGLIEFQAEPNGAGAQSGNNKVALTAAVSQLVFVTVPGLVTERMEINAIHIYHNQAGSNEGFFFTKPPKAVGVGVTNLGNAFEKPFGTLTLQNHSGKILETLQLNNGVTRGIVLPKSSRLFTNSLTNVVKQPGPYTVVASVSYGPGSTIITGKKTFWYIPVWLMIVLIAIVVLLVIAVWLARRRYKKSTARHHFR